MPHRGKHGAIMTIERIAHSGAWLCTAMKGNRLVHMTYYFSTKRAALAIGLNGASVPEGIAVLS